MSPEPTVFVVDDDQAFRHSLRLLLQSAGLAVEAYGSAQAFLDAYDPERSGCLLLDVRMPHMSGLDLQEALAAKHISIPIIFITGHGDIPTSVKAFKSGAVDFLEKPFKDEELLICIDQAIALDGRQRQAKAKKAAVEARIKLLTPREQEVMALVIAGKSNKDIAAQLEVSHRTIEFHRARIMEKTQAKSLSELIIIAMAGGVSYEGA